MAGRAAAKLQKELKRLAKTPLPFCKIGPVEDNILLWHALISGPESTPYEGGVFKVEFQYPEEYPIKPPKVAFVTQIYHPNVSVPSGGSVCVDVIGTGDNWSPVLKTSDILQKLYSMLSSPNGQSPLEAEIGDMYNTNPAAFAETARKWTKKYAKPS